VIKHPPARDREQPGPPRGLVPAEAGQAAHDLHPGFRRHVVGRIGGENPQVAQQGRVGVTPQHGERRLAAVLGGRQQDREILAHHTAEYPQYTPSPATKSHHVKIAIRLRGRRGAAIA
jgi:hypothetical protein